MEVTNEKLDSPNENQPVVKPTSKNENENGKVNVISVSAFQAFCPGYNVEKTFTLSFSIDAAEERQSTEKVLIGNHLMWYMYAQRKTHEGESYLTPFICGENVEKYPISFDVQFTLEAKSADDTLVRKQTCAYDHHEFDMTGRRIIAWKKLLEERDKFEVDGKLTLTATLSVRLPTCCNFNVENSICDVKLKVGDETFPFNKTILAMHSPFFVAMFFGPLKEANQDEVTLTDVKVLDFVNLINVLLIRSFELKVTSAGSVLHLADRFGMLMIVEHCEKLLVDCSLPAEPCLAERMVLAGKYSLKKLQERCLTLCDSIAIAKEVMASPHYKDISDAMKVLLFERVMSFPPTACQECVGTKAAMEVLTKTFAKQYVGAYAESSSDSD